MKHNLANTNYNMLDRCYSDAEKFVKHIAQGTMRSLIINGPPGVGKSVMTEKFLKKHKSKSQKIITGHMTLLSLYGHLHNHREKGQVLVLDDVDSVFSKIEGLCLLKAAMDTKYTNTISWESNTPTLNALGLPLQFKFNGGVILITNVGYGGSRTKADAHLKALKDRSYVIPITESGSDDAKYNQICYMVEKQGLLKEYKLKQSEIEMLLDWLKELNDEGELYTISLRTMIKLADLYKKEPNDWKNMAVTSLSKYGK